MNFLLQIYIKLFIQQKLFGQKILDKLLIICTFLLGLLVAKGIDVYFILKKYFFEECILKSKKIII